MAKKEAQKAAAVPAQPVVPPTYSHDEVMYREDLLEKIYTCEHAISILKGRDDSAGFIEQLKSIQMIFRNWYQQAVMSKQAAKNEPETKEPGKDEGEAAESGDEPDET
jgi:hypothetical protein